MLTLCDIADRAQSNAATFIGNENVRRLEAVAHDTHHTLAAEAFVNDALRFASEAARRRMDAPIFPGTDHVNAQRLCLAIRDFAMIQFGESAAARLSAWHIATSREVGQLVRDMVRFGAMRTGPRDSFDDFDAPDCPNPAETVSTDPESGDSTATYRL
jgi:uncharacterized repeat protein (TIGR04138 family)